MVTAPDENTVRHWSNVAARTQGHERIVLVKDDAAEAAQRS